MILKSIKLKNFKCYEDFSQDFDLGITSICGENGAGKSSIIEAISWALFNFLPYSASSRIIKKGSKSAEVELYLQSSLDGEDYLIRRKTQGQTSVLSLKNKSVVTEGVGNLQTWIRHQLGLRQSDNLSSICRNGIATPQGNLSLDFLESTENRRKIFDVLLGLDEYKTVHTSLGEVLKILSEKTSNLRVDLAKSDYVDEELKTIEGDCKSKKQEMLELKSKVERFERELDELNKQIVEAKEVAFSYEECKKDKQRTAEDLKETEELLVELNSKKQEKSKLDELASRYELFKEERKELNIQKQNFDLLNTKKVQLGESLKIEKENLAKTKKELTSLQDLKTQFAELKQSVDEFKLLDEKEKDLTRDKSLIEAEIKLKGQLETDLKASGEEISSLLSSITETEQKRALLDELPTLEKQLDVKRAEFHEVSKLEKTRESLLVKQKAELPEFELKLDASLEEISLQSKKLNKELKLKEEQLKKAVDHSNKLEAQIELNEKLLPDLIQSVKCPLLNEPCKNLGQNLSQNLKGSLGSGTEETGKDGGLKATFEQKEKDMQDALREAELDVSRMKKELEALELSFKYLSEFESIQKQIGDRQSIKLIAEGKELKQKTEEAQKWKTLFLQLGQKQENLEKAREKKKQFEEKLNKIEKKEKQLVSLKAVLGDLSQQLQQLKPIAEKALIMSSEIQKEEVFKSVLNEQELKVNNLSEQVGQTKTELGKIELVPERLVTVEKQLEELEPVFIQWSQLCRELKIFEETQEKQEKLKLQLDSQEKQLEELTLKLKDKTWIEEHNASLEVKQKEFAELSGLLHSLNFVIQEKENRLAELNELKADLQKQKEKLGSVQQTETKVNKMRGYFKELSIQMAKSYTQKISKKASSMFKEIMQDSAYELEWTEDYEIVMYKNGQELSFENLSGGQQTAASIAVRLGLLQELSNIRFAFFDEPTAHLDVERRNQLAMQIASIQSFNQLFVITHDESFASQANNVIQVGSEEPVLV